MNIRIIETKEEKTLELFDKNGIEFTNDFIGNVSELNYDNDFNAYIMTEDNFNWWEKVVSEYQVAIDRIEKIKEHLNEKDIESFMNEIYNVSCDLEQESEYINTICDEFKNLLN